MDCAALDRLYSAPLSAFTATRDALAKDARAKGDRALAAEIRALAKPAPPAWALNQLARRDPRRFARWLAAVGALHAAEVALISGRADADALRRARAAEREAMGALRAAAAAVLRGAALNASAGMLDRVARTFRGAAVDAAAREALTAGRLTAEHDEPGFEALAGGVGRAAGRAPAAPPSTRTRAAPAVVRGVREDRAAAARRTRLLALRERLRAARAECTTARAEAERSRRAAEEAARRASEASADAREKARALARAETTVSALERDVARLEKA